MNLNLYIMKKLILILGCVIVAIGAYATYSYTASCGAQVYKYNY